MLVNLPAMTKLPSLPGKEPNGAELGSKEFINSSAAASTFAISAFISSIERMIKSPPPAPRIPDSGSRFKFNSGINCIKGKSYGKQQSSPWDFSPCGRR